MHITQSKHNYSKMCYVKVIGGMSWRLYDVKRFGIYCVLSLSLLVITLTDARSEETVPFRVTSIDGELKLRMTLDDYTGSLSSGGTFRKGSSFEQVFDINVDSYVYHPNLLRLNFGGGPVFNQYKFNSNLDDLSGRDQTFNFHVAANILEKKPYPLSLYFNHVYGNGSATTQDRMLLESTMYGVNFSLLRPLLPVTINFNLGSAQTKGSNDQRVTDSDRDVATVTMSGDIGESGNGFIGLYRVQSKYQSGARALPVVTRNKKTDTLNIRTEHWFFETKEAHLSNFFSYIKENNQFAIDKFSFNTDLNWEHSDSRRAYYRYAYRDNSLGSTDTSSHSLSAGLNSYFLERSLQVRAGGASGLHSSSDGFQQNNYNANLSLNYLQDLGSLRINYNAGWIMDYTDREVSTPDVTVLAESQVLNNTTPVDLANQNVISGTVVVTNQIDTQTYVENIDYVLTVVGNITHIQRIPTGNISNGENVSINYSFDSGGTVAYSGIRQTYGVNISKGNYFSVYGNYQQRDWSLESGNPTTPFHASKNMKLGFSLDVPFANNWLWGGRGDIMYAEEVYSTQTYSAGIYVRLPVRHNANLRLFSDWRNTESDEVEEDTDMIRYGLRFTSRPWFQTTFMADVITENETGREAGKRSYTSVTTRLNWAVRQLRLTANANYDVDTLGLSERERTRFSLLVSRRF